MGSGGNSTSMNDSNSVAKRAAKVGAMAESLEKGPTSLFIFDENNFIRLKVRVIIENSFFEYFVLSTIIANCVVLAMEAHLPNNDRTSLAIQIVSLII